MVGKLNQLATPGWRDRFPDRWTTLLRLAVSITLLSRGWLTWRWDSPIRGLVWKEDWWAPQLERWFSLPWSKFAEQSDRYISSGMASLGLLLIALASVPWLSLKGKWFWTRWFLFPAALILLLDSVARWVARDYEIGMAIEHSLQIVTPIVLFIALSFPGKVRLWNWIIVVSSGLTFVGHGLYAMGFHPVPLSYQLMTMKILGVSPPTAVSFLLVVGWLDVVAAVGAFLPRWNRYALCYLIAWGFATALARVVAHCSLAQETFGLDPWLAETLVRTPHWLLPFLLLGSLVPRRQSTEPYSQ